MCIKDISDTVTMTRFIIFATLMAALFANGISESEKLIVEDGGKEYLYFEVEGDKCMLRSNIGKEYICIPDIDDDLQLDDDIFCGIFTCSFLISLMTSKDVGNWTITSYFKNESDSKTFEVYISQMVQVIPDSPINVVEGNFVYVELDVDLENFTSCEAIAPNGQRIDLLTENRDDFSRYGKCGFSAMLTSVDSGQWNLLVTTDDQLVYTGYSTIVVRKNSNRHNEMKNIRLKRGSKDHLDVDIDDLVISCQLTDPLGVIYPVTIGSCKQIIPVVTIRHEGIWTARYAVKGNLNLSYVFFEVITYESQTIESNVTRMENGDIQLQCHVYKEDFDPVSCQFIRPDRQVLNLFPGIGSEHYRPFNVFERGTRSRHYSCGVIILSPILNEDIGMWTCIINSNKYLAAVSAIRVDSSLLSGYETQSFTQIDAKNVYVKQGESFQITCIADAPLNYCWFRSPNGTMYSVSQKQPQTLSSLPYRGSGLSLGECRAEIGHAEFTDQGQWTCNLGIVNGSEEHKSFSVNVVDSYVIPAKSEVYAREGDFVNLSCSILPNVRDRAVHYCRWIRPDGYGIHNGKGHPYRTFHTNTRCELIMPEIQRDKDMGKWTCVAGLQGAIDEEAWTTITVIHNSPPV